MKVLALVDYQCCFLSHTILTGLWEMENVEVYEMPVLQSVRGRIDEGYDLPDGKRGMTGCTGYLQPNPLPEQTHTAADIADLGFNGFDLIVALSTRDYVKRSLQLLAQNWGNISSKLVICDGEDSEYIDRDFINTWKPRVFFKRELSRKYAMSSYESAYGLPVMPLQFGAFTRSLPVINDEEKTLDFFCSLGRTNPIRDRFLVACLDAVYKKQVCASGRAWIATNSDSPLVTDYIYGLHLHNLQGWNQYMSLQGQSKIGASVVGFGNDCLHSWELFSFATLALYQDTGLHIPYPFRNGRHCLYINEDQFSILHHIIRDFLEEEERRMAVARAGRDWCHLHHSTKARAQYLVDIAMKVLGGEKIQLEEYGLQS